MRLPLRIRLGYTDQTPTNADWEDVTSEWQDTTENWEDTILIVSANPNDKVLDMFEDESVVITDKVKDYSDVSKLFTEFSRTITVPATKKNNKLLKHAYDVSIEGNDLRNALDCDLLLNNEIYKQGNLTVMGATLRYGKPYQYEIQFVGQTTELKKKIGRDELSVLDFSDLDIAEFNGKNAFATASANQLVFPLATRSDRFIMHSTAAYTSPNYSDFEGYRNIQFSTNSVTDGFGDNMVAYYGINDSDLVGALKVGRILDEIEDNYGVDFTGAFTRDYIRDMYLWLHKKQSDDLSEAKFFRTNDLARKEITPGNFSPALNESYADATVNGLNVKSFETSTGWQTVDFKIKIESDHVTSGTEIVIKRDGKVVATYTAANEQHSFAIGGPNGEAIPGFYSIGIRSMNSGTCNINVQYQVVLRAKGTGAYLSTNNYFYDGTVDYSGGNPYIIADNLPQMKIMDFLTSLFKMFNIVAIVEGQIVNPNARSGASYEIRTEHYDHFMAQGVDIDFQKYADIKEMKVERAIIYSSIDMDFAEGKLAMEEAYQNVNGSTYGDFKYIPITNDTQMIDKSFKLTLKNQRFPLERLALLATNPQVNSDVVTAQFSDLESSEQNINPAFTYICSITSGTNLAYSGTTTSGGGTLVPYTHSISNYVLPSNFYSNNARPSSALNSGLVSLSWGDEINEHSLDSTPVGLGLVNNFYKDMFGVMFNVNTRMVTLKANLNEGILQRMKISDRLNISGRLYRIMEMKVNYLTGQSDFKLLDVSSASLEPFKKVSRNVTNTNGVGGTALKVTYLDYNGFLQEDLVFGGQTDQIDCIGEIRSFSHDNYTDVLL